MWPVSQPIPEERAARVIQYQRVPQDIHEKRHTETCQSDWYVFSWHLSNQRSRTQAEGAEPAGSLQGTNEALDQNRLSSPATGKIASPWRFELAFHLAEIFTQSNITSVRNSGVSIKNGICLKDSSPSRTGPEVQNQSEFGVLGC